MGKARLPQRGVTRRIGSNGAVTYYVRWSTSEGRRLGATFDDLDEGLDFRAQQVRTVRLGGSANPRKGNRVFADWWQEWMGSRTSLRLSTQQTTFYYGNAYILPTFGSKRLIDITHGWIARWDADLIERGLSVATRNEAMVLLKASLGQAVAHDLIAANPARAVSSPRQIKRERRFLNPHEVYLLEKAMDEHWRLAVPFLVDTGLRFGELSALRVGDIDLGRGEVSVCRSASNVSLAISGHSTRRLITETKSESSDRIVPTLTPSVCVRLVEMIDQRGLRPDDLLFSGPEGAALNRNWRSRVWAPAIKGAALSDPQPTPHSLRHTAVSFWIATGTVDRMRLAKWLGHSSPLLIDTLYGHLFPVDTEPTRSGLEQMRLSARGSLGSPS